MLPRNLQTHVSDLLTRHPAVALIGPRQVGKTTLARSLAADRRSVYLDLESPRDAARLSDPVLYLGAHLDELVVLDEVQRMPNLFQVLRGVIDEARATGRGTGRFLLLGSASRDLLAQTSESLAGRIIYAELGGLSPAETAGVLDVDALWHRGGFPNSALASNDAASLEWREAFIRTYLERDIPALGPRIPAETLRRLWTMLAHAQGGLLNASTLAAGLGVSGQTVTRYVDLLVDLLLVRRLHPFLTNVGKRLVRSPKVYVRDSGIVHALLGLSTLDAVLSHPVAGPSWEGFVIETLLASAPASLEPFFYRTAAGAELDLVLQSRRGTTWAIEIKRSSDPRPTAGFHTARKDIDATRAFVVHAGDDRFPLAPDVEAISLPELTKLVGTFN